MNCRLNIASFRRSARGFTMIEIAIALGVIGFALVAIIGILPIGLEVQRDNRSETIINQDATLWLEAIRSGAVGMNELPSYVENISLIKRDSPDPGANITYSNRWALLGSGKAADNFFQSGADIVGLLTWAVAGQVPGNPIEYREVRAQITAISGSAAEKELDSTKEKLAFAYLLRVVIEPRRDPEDDLNDTSLPFGAVTGEPVTKIEHFGYPDSSSPADIRLTFSYPFIGENRTPPRSQNYRASVSRHWVNDPVGSEYFYFRP